MEDNGDPLFLSRKGAAIEQVLSTPFRIQNRLRNLFEIVFAYSERDTQQERFQTLEQTWPGIIDRDYAVRFIPQQDSKSPVGTRREYHPDGLYRILTEDSNAGHQMFSCIATHHGIQCDSAQGKSNVFGALMNNMHRRTLVIADGAAFGADMEKVYQFLTLHPGHVTLYLPESFEWLLLKAGIIRSPELDDILSAPADHIDSDQYFSWEQFFTALLINLTSQRDYMRYNKQRLPAFYLQDENVQKVLDAMETD